MLVLDIDLLQCLLLNAKLTDSTGLLVKVKAGPARGPRLGYGWVKSGCAGVRVLDY